MHNWSITNHLLKIFQIDDKQLCWLCTLSYKRALAKAKQVQAAPRMKKRSAPEENSTNNKASKTSSSDRLKKSQPRPENKSATIEIPVAKNVSPAPTVDPHSSEHVVALTQLKETIASLQKRLAAKDRELLQKDKEMTELKGKHFTLENELRTKMKDEERLSEMKIELLNKKLSAQLKEIAALSKSSKRNNFSGAVGGGGGGGTKTDSDNDRTPKETASKDGDKESGKSVSPKSQESPDTNKSKSPASNRSKSPDTTKDSSSSDSDDSRDNSRDD